MPRLSEGGPILGIGDVPRVSPGAPASPAMPAAAPTPGAAALAPQLALALSSKSGGTVEIRLDPEELGRVRVSLSGSETALTMTVLAERPETAELMRRHADGLLREFRAMGYETITLAFGESGGRPGSERSDTGRDGRDDGAGSTEPEPSTAVPGDPLHHRPALTAITGLDIRL